MRPLWIHDGSTKGQNNRGVCQVNKIELWFALASCLQPCLVSCLIVSILTSVVSGIAWASLYPDGEDGMATAKKVLKIAVPSAVLLGFLTCISGLPEALIEARVRYVKLEITSEPVRKKMYEEIEKAFKKVEQKYLPDDQKKEAK